MKKPKTLPINIEQFASMFGGVMNETVPKGFRKLPMMQALMEYGNPIAVLAFKYTKDMNVPMKLTQSLWNYEVAINKKTKKQKDEILNAIRKDLKLDKKKSELFFDEMIERANYLFPSEIQPANKMTVFMRVDKEIVIEKFN